MSDDAKPLVQLDPQGTPAILSYNVPEPTTYSGKNYIELSQLPPNAFTIPVAATPRLPVQQIRPVRLAQAAVRDSLQQHPALSIAAQPEDDLALVRALEPVTDRLASLRSVDVRAAAEAGAIPQVFRGSAGLLDIRMVPADSGETGDGTPQHRGLNLRPGEGGDGGPDPEPKFLTLIIGSPAQGATLKGPAAGVTLTVTGDWEFEGLRGRPTISLAVDGSPSGVAEVSASGERGTWQASITITTSGAHHVTVHGTGAGRSANAQLDINVDLDQSGGGTATLPTITVSTPRDRQVVTSSSGSLVVTFQGTATSNVAGEPVLVEVTDESTGTTASTTVAPDHPDWSVDLPVEGLGQHVIRVGGRRGQLAAPGVTITLTVSDSLPTRRLVNRLLISETLSLTSFLGSFGAGRVLRTFSLLPGERTTISIKTFTQSDETRKQAASILDSAASEASSEFDDAVSREQANKAAESEASNYKVGAEASATWGWGSAKISAEFSGSANSAREEAVKNVKTATQKHASKASSNRSVTVNTDYEVRVQEKQEESTTREIANINVSRTLNFTFRQLNQEHIVLVHLTNIRVAFYSEDLILDAAGNPEQNADGSLSIRRRYQEVSLPELASLLDGTIVPSWHERVKEAIVRVLTGIPDYTDTLRAVVETAVPTDQAGEPVPGSEYLRFPRNLSTRWKDPAGESSFTVPGIVLSFDKITMRTDGVVVDALLGQGDALDQYSHGLQDQSVETQRVANAQAHAAVSREELAQRIVSEKDEAAAALYAKLFVPPLPSGSGTPGHDTPSGGG